MNKDYLILGAGHQGLAMAAHFKLDDNNVFLWNRTKENIESLIKNRDIKVKGIINDTVTLDKVSSNIEDVLSKNIFIATPASAHSALAKLLAPLVDSDTIIVLNPGRTLGCIDFKKELIKNGCKNLPMIAETQTIIYTCRKNSDNEVQIYTFKNEVEISSFNKVELDIIYDRLPDCFKKYLLKVDSMINTSIGNVGMILHPLTTLLNISKIESDNEFKFYYEGITPSISTLLEELDSERLLIAEKLGVSISSTMKWMQDTYKIEGDNLYNTVRNNMYYKDIYGPSSINTRYIDEDVPFGLVTLEAIGKLVDVSIPMTSLVIDLANKVMNKDYRIIGRLATEDDIIKLKGDNYG